MQEWSSNDLSWVLLCLLQCFLHQDCQMTRSGLTWATGLTAPTNSVNSRTLGIRTVRVLCFSNGSHWWVADGWQRPYYRGWCGSFGMPAGCGGLHCVPLQMYFPCSIGMVKIQVTWSSPLTWTYIWTYKWQQEFCFRGELHPRNSGKTHSIQLKAWNEMRQASALSIFEWKSLPRRVHLHFFFFSLFSFLFFFSQRLRHGRSARSNLKWVERPSRSRAIWNLFQDVPRSYVSICQCWARSRPSKNHQKPMPIVSWGCSIRCKRTTMRTHIQIKYL